MSVPETALLIPQIHAAKEIVARSGLAVASKTWHRALHSGDPEFVAWAQEELARAEASLDRLLAKVQP